MADLAVAVLGAGVHGSRYAEHLQRGDVPGARLAGVCRRSPADGPRWTARGVRFETAFEALVDDPAVDAVVIASPPEAHLAQAEAVLARGKPLLLEKPVAPDPASCERIRRAARVPVLVGHSHRYNPVARAIRAALPSLGPIRGLTVSLRHERMPQEWQHRPPGGGALLSVGTHAADLARWLGGGDVVLESCLREGAPGEAEGSAVALGRLPGGGALLIDVSITTPARRGLIEVRAEGGVLEGDLVLHECARREGRTRVPLPLEAAGPGLVPLLRDFVAAARGGDGGIAATLDDGVAAVAFAEACRRYSPR